jgi:hypothetical protein
MSQGTLFGKSFTLMRELRYLKAVIKLSWQMSTRGSFLGDEAAGARIYSLTSV